MSPEQLFKAFQAEVHQAGPWKLLQLTALPRDTDWAALPAWIQEAFVRMVAAPAASAASAPADSAP